MIKIPTSDCSSSDQDYIPADQEDSVRVKDRQRAAVCCLAVDQEAETAKSIFAKYGDLNFRKAILAPSRLRPRILVATAYDFCNNTDVYTTYVAFRGSSALETVFDVAGSKLQCQGPVGTSVVMKGYIHDGFFKVLMEELPGPMELKRFCANMVPEMDRLVFCGHGLGGALSHASMLSLLFSSFGHNTDEWKKSENSFISIAFGAPLFLNEEARDYFSPTGVVPVENRFHTYINYDDPVPLMLNKIMAYPAGAGQQNLHKMWNSTFQTILEVCGRVPILVKKEDLLLEGSLDSGQKITVPDDDMRKLKAIRCKRGRGYAPFGQFTRLSRRGLLNLVSPSDLDSWTLSWTQDSVKYHAMGHYAFNVLLLLEPSPVPVPDFGEGNAPKVDGAFVTITSGPQRLQVNRVRLEVVGYNLGLCLRKKCAVSDFAHKWEITRVEPNSIVFRNKVKLNEAEANLLTKNITGVKIETMFGVTEWIAVRTKASGSNSHVIDGLKHVVGKIVILSSVDDIKPGSPSSKRLETLKHHLKTVATLLQDQSCLSLFVCSLEDAKKKVFEKRKDADAFIQQLCDYLQKNPLKFKLAPMSLYSESSIATIVAGHILLGVTGSILSYWTETNLKDYDDKIKFIYMNLMDPGEALPRGTDTTVREYEKAIIEKVNILNSKDPSDWVRKVLHKLRYCVQETRDTVVNYITLMHEIDKAVTLAKEQKVLAVVGPENAGKTTLINTLRYGAPKDVDEDEQPGAATTGYLSHTDDAKGYFAMDVESLVVVDFPGMGAADERHELTSMWEAFERLPDLCLVLMTFNGDVTDDCSHLPKQVRKKLCDKVVLMVNKVDSIMKGRETARIWRQYPPAKMEELRQAFVRNSDDMLDSVMLTSLSRDLHDGEKGMLKERGILFAQDVLDHIIRLVERPVPPAVRKIL